MANLNSVKTIINRGSNKMNQSFRVLICLLFIVALVITVSNQNITVANTGVELEGKIELYNRELEHLEVETGQVKQQLNKVDIEINELDREVDLLDREIIEVNEKIRNINGSIDKTKNRINDLQEEIGFLEARIGERDILIKDRARSIYKNGTGIQFIEVILGAQNFGDLINRLTALNAIAQQDRNILNQHILDKELLDEAQMNLQLEVERYEGELLKAQSLSNQLELQYKEKEKLMDMLVQLQGELEDQVMTIEEEQAILKAQEQAAQRELNDWKEEQRKVEEQRRIEAEKNRSVQSSNQTPASNVSRSANTEGLLLRPATGSITTGFEMRWGRMHYGIDIGKNGRTEDVPIVAAESGTVIRSYYSASYGNTVLVRHHIDGRTITTLYAHLDNRAVVTGDTVTRGQFLGYMGNTGRSFGPHLHFEVHEGDWNSQKSNAVDPMLYIQ